MNKHAPKHIWAWNQEFFKHAEAQPKKGCAYKKKNCVVRFEHLDFVKKKKEK